MLSKAGLSHRTYVENLLKYYKENDIQQGDPNEGVWHRAHYPQPNRLGGQTVVLLLAEHHAVQGVLQSEEFGVTCVTGAFGRWLLGTPWEESYRKWLSWNGRQAGLVGGKVGGKKRWETSQTTEYATVKRRKSVTVTSPEGIQTTFESLTLACSTLGLTKSALSSVISGTRNHHKGYTATYD